MSYSFTSESVTCGHPDKVCDQIADNILDEILKVDPNSRVACEVTATTNSLNIMGEVTTSAKVNYDYIARDVIRKIGYVEPDRGFDYKNCHINVNIHEQSPDIAVGIKRKDILVSGAVYQGGWKEGRVGKECRR